MTLTTNGVTYDVTYRPTTHDLLLVPTAPLWAARIIIPLP